MTSLYSYITVREHGHATEFYRKKTRYIYSPEWTMLIWAQAGHTKQQDMMKVMIEPCADPSDPLQWEKMPAIPANVPFERIYFL